MSVHYVDVMLVHSLAFFPIMRAHASLFSTMLDQITFLDFTLVHNLAPLQTHTQC